MARPDNATSAARAELQAWYVQRLQPKVARAASTGAVDARAAAAFDVEVRRFLELSEARDKAA
jgi:hypothetical protein